MVKSIVAIEDYRFYQHGALDLKGTLRALVTNQANGGVGPGWLVDHPADGQADAARPGEDQEGAQGGHRRHLRPQGHASCATRSPSSRTTPRTGSSSATSTSPTSATAPTASRRRPGTTSTPTPRTSTCAQGAMLAGLVKNPTGYDPTTNPDRALERRNVVLDRMAQLNVITAAQGRQAQEAAARPAPGRHAQRLRELQRAVLLRLRRRATSSRTRRSARPSRPARSCSTPAA